MPAIEKFSIGRWKIRCAENTVFQRLVHYLEQHPLLRVHGFGFLAGYAEELRIEQANVLIEKVSIASICLCLVSEL